MLECLRKNWVIITILIGLLLIITIELILSLKNTNNKLVYAGDDAYIHMAISKNFSKYGIWGVTKYSFSSSSSSLLWTLLLSFLYEIFGTNEIAPFILNIIFSILILILSHKILKCFNIYGIYNFFTLLAILFFSPLPAVVFTGMEHTLHILLSLMFIYLVIENIIGENLKKEKKWLLIISPLIIMVRFENIFLVFTACVLFIMKKRIRSSIIVGFLAALPVLVYGFISISHGWYFFPNSILLKGNMINYSSVKGFIKSVLLFKNINLNELMNPLFALFLISLFLIIYDLSNYRNFWEKPILFNFIFLVIALFHIKFAKLGGFYRYEAYLITIGIMAVSVIFPLYLAKNKNTIISNIYKIAIIILSLLIGYQMVLRSLSSLKNIPTACTNIYQQQYQMGLFLKSFYQGKEVAANDIGAINYLAEIKNLDLWGMGSIEVAKLRRAKKYNREAIYELTKKHHTKISIIYDNWFRTKELGGVPSEWIKIGEWKIPNNIVCGGNIVSFYAVDPNEKDNLLHNLKKFSQRLPQEVNVKFYYE